MNDDEAQHVAEIPECLLARDDLGAARLLLTAMYRLTPRTETEPRVWARTTTLAAMIGANSRTAQRQLQTLVSAGVIEAIPGGWRLMFLADGSKLGKLGKTQDGDDIVAKGDSSVGSRRQNCRPKRQDRRGQATELSFPTLEEPGSEPGSNRESRSDQLPLLDGQAEEPESTADVVRRVWDYQDNLRRWAYEKRGRTGARAPRKLRLDTRARKIVAGYLREYSEEDLREVLRSAARDASSSDRSLQYFDGVSNWRPANFARHMNADHDLRDAARRTTVRQQGAGTSIEACANDSADESCRRVDLTALAGELA